jgi:hypothetical protein
MLKMGLLKSHKVVIVNNALDLIAGYAGVLVYFSHFKLTCHDFNTIV